MIVVKHLLPSQSPKIELKKFIDDIKALNHPSWSHEKTIAGEDVVYYNPYQYYNDKRVVFRTKVAEGAIVFEPINFFESNDPLESEVKYQIIRLCSLIIKEYFEEGMSLQII